MKKLFTISSFLVLSVIFLAGCAKRDAGFNENYWLTRERGEVVYSDSYCNYYVVETNNGYSVIRSHGSYQPYEGSIVYGDFGFAGTQDFYNRSSGVIFTGTVTDYWLSYNEALDALDYYCPLGNTASSSTSNFRKRN